MKNITKRYGGKDILTDEQIQERDPAALQLELLAIDKEMALITPEVDENQAYQVAKAELEEAKMKRLNVVLILLGEKPLSRYICHNPEGCIILYYRMVATGGFSAMIRCIIFYISTSC